MRIVVLTFLVAIGLQACTKKDIDLKSPCVGIEKSPCERRPANAWLNQA